MPHTICETWGRVTKVETRARNVLLSTIRLCYLFRPPYGDETIRIASDEFKELVTEQTPLSEAYALLTPEQKAKAREITENPAVRFYGPDRKERWIDENLDLLARLEAGTPVGPVGEKEIVQTAGTNPELRADRFVSRWNELSNQADRHYASGNIDAHKNARSAMANMARSLERDPQLESLLASRKAQLGITMMDSQRKLGAQLAFEHGLDLGRGRGRGLGL